MGVVLHVQSKLLCIPHAHRRKKLLQDLQNVDNTAMRRARQNDAMTFRKCLGVSQEDNIGPTVERDLSQELRIA